jgi:release factor glutamine methyltransferase
MTIRELMKYGEEVAINNGKEDSAVKLLLMHVLNKDSAEILMNLNEKVEDSIVEDFKHSLNEYVVNNVPVQHILGYEYFYGYKFIVGKDVLIPRFETEELVANVLAAYDEFFGDQIVDVVDVGTGSGAIAITLAKEERNMRVDATDISEEALTVAKQNALNLDAKVNFVAGDMLKPLVESGKKYDLLVSNPPYIPEEEYVESLVKDNEPHVALFGGLDGMYFYDIILREAHQILKQKSIIAFEHGWNQKDKMIALIKQYFPNSEYEIIKDLNGKDRMTIIKNG